MDANVDGISSICFTNIKLKNKMTKLAENNPQGTANIADDRVLSAGISYTIGKFLFLLDEETGDLKLSVHTNRDSLKITPKSDNSIILHACR